MRNVVFLHKRTLYFAVASRKGCVDLSMIQFARCIKRISRIPQGMRGFKLDMEAVVFIILCRIPQGMRGFKHAYHIPKNPKYSRIPQGMRGFKRHAFFCVFFNICRIPQGMRGF